jgi:uncharacterized membrane protein YbjE (DUF340 family)
MIILAAISLLLGILCSQLSLIPENWITFITGHSEEVLLLLMLLVGISIGNCKEIFQKVRTYHFRILIIPLGIISASVLGGIVSGFLLQMPLSDSTAIASGLGWYSLSGVMMTELSGAQMGSIAFLSNLMREVLSFFLIPLLAKYLNPYTAIAPAAATSEDTTLSMLIKYTSEEVVVLAVFNGVICSAVVPVLTRFFYALFS